MMDFIERRNVNISLHDVKKMWRACDRAKKSGDSATLEVAVQKVVVKRIGMTVSDDCAKELSKEIEPSLEKYDAIRKKNIILKMILANTLMWGAAAIGAVGGGGLLLYALAVDDKCINTAPQAGDGIRAGISMLGAAACFVFSFFTGTSLADYAKEAEYKIACSKDEVRRVFNRFIFSCKLE
ncbi:MAG: hypothetical protein NTX79_03565 [Candidatus Micrarchaeota archaeon]|nr:hypothetical protein [Candidatus Micrarchaeota archaeon]